MSRQVGGIQKWKRQHSNHIGGEFAASQQLAAISIGSLPGGFDTLTDDMNALERPLVGFSQDRARWNSGFSVWLPVAIALIILFAGVGAWRVLRQEGFARIDLHTQLTLANAVRDIAQSVESVAGSVQRQAERLDRREADAEFKTEVAQYLRDFPFILAERYQIAGTTVTQAVRPPLTAESLFGFAPPVSDAGWQTTSANFQQALSPSVRIGVGKFVYFLTYAVPRSGEKTERRFTTVLDAVDWLGRAIDEEPDYEISIRDGDLTVDRLASGANADPTRSQSADAVALGHTWKVSVAPVRSVTRSVSSIPLLVLAGSALLAIITAGLARAALLARARRDLVWQAEADRSRQSEQRRVAELARDAAKRELGSILESITDIFFIVDKDWRYVYVNQFTAARIGQTAQELIGKSLWELRPVFRDSPQAALVREAMRDRTARSFDYRAGDGRYYMARIYPHLDGLALYFHDITEQQKIADHLSKSEEQLRQIQSIAAVGSFVRNPDGSEHWNEQLCRIIGEESPLETPRHVPFLDFVDPSDRERISAAEADLGRAAQRTESQAHIVTVRGERRPVRICMRQVLDAAHRSTTIIGTVQDVAEQERINEALRAALQHSRQQSAKFRALNRAMLLISAKLGHSDLDQILVEELREAIGANVATLHFVDADGRPATTLTTAAGRYEDSAVVSQAVEILNRFAEGQHGEKVLRLSREASRLHPIWMRYSAEHIAALPLDGLLSVPLHDRAGKLIGFLQASESRDGEFTADDEAIAVQFAQIASIALGWGRLIEELRGAESRLSEQLDEAYRSRTLLAEAEQVARLGSWEADAGQGAATVLSLSDEAVRILHTSKTVSLESLAALMHVEDEKTTYAQFLAIFEQSTSILDIEFRLILESGTRWVHVKAKPMGTRGTRTRIVGILQDVTEQRLNAMQERFNAQMFAGIAAGAGLEDSLRGVINLYENRFPEGMCSILLLDAENRLHTAAASRLPSEYSSLIDGLRIGPDAGSCGTAAWRGSRVIVRDTHTDPLWQAYAEIAARFQLRACWSTPIFDRVGNVLGTFAVYYREQREPTKEELDCVDRATSVAAVAISAYRARQQIEDSEQRFRSLFAYVPQAVFAIDMHGRIVDCNDAAVHMTGYSREQLLNSQAEMTVTPEDRPRFVGHLSLVAAGAPQQIELTRLRPDGSRYITSATKTPIVVDGSVVGIFSIVQDVTHERANQIALEDALRTVSARNSELEEFAFIASHDLQEPLRKVRAFGDRLRLHLGASADTEVIGFIERMRVAAERMQRLIDDLLAYSRIAKRDISIRTVDLHDIVTDVLADLETRIEQTGACVDCGDLPVVQAEETQMRQVFQNLISNALKFRRADRAPHVIIHGEVYVRPDDSFKRPWVRVNVRDNGIGFENRFAERIFAPFQRLHGRDEYEGSGIGLAIVRRIAERHGGRVFAASTPDQGAVFTIEMPQQYDAGAPAEPQLHAAGGLS